MPIRQYRYTSQPTISSYGVPSTASYIAGEDLAGHLIVRVSNGLVYRADPMSNPFQVIGMTSGAAQASQPVTVIQQGACDGVLGLDPAATFFLGPGGVPTTTSPNRGVVLVVATAQDSTTYNVWIGMPYLIL